VTVYFCHCCCNKQLTRLLLTRFLSTSYVCWWHSTFHFFCHLWILHQHFTPASHSWSCLSMDVFQSFVTLSVQDGVSPHWSSCSISQNSRHSLLMPSKTPPITPNSSSRNLGIIFVRSTLSMYYFICSVSKSCFISIRDLRRIRNTRSWLHHRTHYHHISRTLKTR